jgi:hypothetical protein
LECHLYESELACRCRLRLPRSKTGTLALAAVPVVVFPNPVQFGTVPLNSTGSPLAIYLTNTTASSINVSNITISGTSSSNFAFHGLPSLGNAQNGGPNVASAIAVSPANSHIIATALNENGCCGGPLEFFTDSTKLANSVTSSGMNQLAFASGTTLYGYIPGTLSQVNVTSTGGTLTQQWNGLVNGNTFQYSGGLVFGGDGQEFNPATGLLQGTFDVGSACCNNITQVLPNSALNRAFALGDTPFFSSLGITSYNLTQFTPLAVADLSQLNPFNSVSTSKFIQWCTSGLAFILTTGCCGTTTSQVVLLQSPSLLLATSKTFSPVPVLKSANPTTVSHGTGNFRLTLRGSGFVPGSVVTWNGKARYARYVSGNEMTVYVTAAAIASTGTAKVVVKNPAPGGGTSNALTFNIK